METIEKFILKGKVAIVTGATRGLGQGIAIGLANKYYDLACMGDDMAAQHYRELSRHASNCVHCGHCDARCPFGVAQSTRMEEIAAYFGE